MKVSAVLILLMIASLPRPSLAQTAEEAYARELTVQIAEALSDSDGEEAIALLAAYRELGLVLPGSFYIAEATAQLYLDDVPKALSAFKKALASKTLSKLETVQTKERIRKLENIIASMEKENLERVRRGKVQRARFTRDYRQILDSSSADDLAAVLQSIDSETRDLFWDLQFVDGGEPVFALQQDFSNNLYGLPKPTTSSFTLQKKVLCEANRETQSELFKYLFGVKGGGVNSRFMQWARYPYHLPKTCWSSWERLIEHLGIGYEEVIHVGEKRLRNSWAPHNYFAGADALNITLGELPIAFAIADNLHLGHTNSSLVAVKTVSRTVQDESYNTIKINGTDVFIDLRGYAIGLATIAITPLSHEDLLYAADDGQEATIEYYKDIIRIYRDELGVNLEQIKYFNCSWQMGSFSFWRALQLEGGDPFDDTNIPLDGCEFLDWGDFGISVLYSGGSKRWTSYRAAKGGFFKNLSATNTETHNHKLLDMFLSGIDEDLDLTRRWGYSRRSDGSSSIGEAEFPLLLAAQTGHCSIYKRLAAAGATDYDKRARKAIRKLDRKCR